MSTNEQPAVDIEKLCTENIPLVYYVYWHKFNKYQNIKERFYDELISAGFLGLLQAARRYDPSTGYKFSTFAAASIERRMYTEARRIFRWYYRSPTVCLEDRRNVPDKNFDSIAAADQRMVVNYVLAKAKEKLYPKHWDILCDYLCGVPVQELAEKHHCKSIGQTLTNIFAKIRKISEEIYKKETKE